MSLKGKKILIVSPFGYDPWDYQVFSEVIAEGGELYHLGHGTFNPTPGVFAGVFHTNLRNIEASVSFVEKLGIQFDGITQACFEAATPFVAALCRAFNTPGNSPLVAFRCRNKHLMRETLNQAGLPSVRTVRCKTVDEVIDAARGFGTGVAKPVAAHSSFGTFFIDHQTSDETIRNRYHQGMKVIEHAIAIGDLWPFTPTDLRFLNIEDTGDLQFDYVVEEFIPGKHLSIDSIINNGLVTSIGFASQERMAPPFFVQLKESMPWVAEPALQASVTKLNEEAINALGLFAGASHTEIIISPDGPKIVEVACRMGGDNIQDAVLQTTGINLMRELIRSSVGLPLSTSPKSLRFAAMEYVLPQKKGTLMAITVPDEVQHHPKITEVFLPHDPGDSFAPPPEGYDYLYYVSAVGDSLTEAQDLVTWAVANIKVELQ